jgi:hypothetical protein
MRHPRCLHAIRHERQSRDEAGRREAKVIIKIDPKKYTKYVAKENGKDVIYVILTKALYGTLQAALLFWQNLSGKLKK